MRDTHCASARAVPSPDEIAAAVASASDFEMLLETLARLWEVASATALAMLAAAPVVLAEPNPEVTEVEVKELI